MAKRSPPDDPPPRRPDKDGPKTPPGTAAKTRAASGSGRKPGPEPDKPVVFKDFASI